jgi:hypothetical protein
MDELSIIAGVVVSNPTRGMDVCVYSAFVLGSCLATGRSLVQGVLPNVLDKEAEIKRSVSRMSYAPSGSNWNKPTKQTTNQPTQPTNQQL